jgi:hypothetical protein
VQEESRGIESPRRTRGENEGWEWARQSKRQCRGRLVVSPYCWLIRQHSESHREDTMIVRTWRLPRCYGGKEVSDSEEKEKEKKRTRTNPLSCSRV